MFSSKKESILLSGIGGVMLLFAGVGLFNSNLDSRIALLVTTGIVGALVLGAALRKFKP